jgi:hypothetical protein
MARTIFIELGVGQFFQHDSVYYTKIDEQKAVRRSIGGDQPYMRQEVMMHPFSEVLTLLEKDAWLSELNDHGIGKGKKQ